MRTSHEPRTPPNRATMRWLPCLLLAACHASATTAPRPSAPADAIGPQDVRAGLRILCASAWNGELYGNRFRQWVPDTLHERITNGEVTRLIESLTAPSDRVRMFDAFVAENHVGDLGACPLRDRLAGWPAELPIIPANKDERTPAR